ncbi:MAG: type II toxin-antitoxin system RatA family toxin [Solirubrobacterales bacterium]
MPEVKIDMAIQAPIERVWETVVDIERYPDSMETIRFVRIVGDDKEGRRRAAWSVLLKGSILEWEEEEHLDHKGHTVAFKQIRGDLEHFDGRWGLKALGPEQTKVVFEVEFEIGIPMLADMLNPVAQRSLQENCTEMLRGIERAAAPG